MTPPARKRRDLSFSDMTRHLADAAHAESNDLLKKTLEFHGTLDRVQEMVQALVAWYDSQGLEHQVLEFDNAYAVQCRRTGTMAKVTGRNSELTVGIRLEIPRIVVEVGPGKWAAKVGVGSAGFLSTAFFPLVGIGFMATAAYGSWEQAQLRTGTISIIEEVMGRDSPPEIP